MKTNAQAIQYIILAILLLLWTGCNTTSTIQSVAKDGEDFDRFSTFALIKASAAQTVPGINHGELMWSHAVVENALKSRSYRKVEQAEADLLVAIETEISASREKASVFAVQTFHHLNRTVLTLSRLLLQSPFVQVSSSPIAR